MAKAAVRIARMRQRAREAGLCTRCCKEKPMPGRVSCVTCNDSSIQRTLKRRQAHRQRARASTLEAYEHAGDVARDHHFHDGAAQHYRHALAACEHSVSDRARLSEKLAYALFRGGDPDAAMPWLERALPQQLDDSEQAAKAVEILVQAWRQLWLDAKTEGALLVVERAMQIANAASSVRLRKLTTLKMITHLRIMGHYLDAERFLLALDPITAEDDAELRSRYFTEKAILIAARGESQRAYDSFENAVQATKEGKDMYYLTVAWGTYAWCAINLGNIELGKTCLERALLVARENQFVWRIAYIGLHYAHVLATFGQSKVAYEFLDEALSYDARAPIIDSALAEFGIPLALLMKDDALLAKCARVSVLERTLQSGTPIDFAAVAAAFASMYAVQGRKRKAQALLHRALEKIHYVEGLWNLLLEVAKHGYLADIPQARRLLENRLLLPSSSVAGAVLRLFDGFVARREGQIAKMHRDAATAIELFEKLHWYAYADIARSLLPSTSRPERLQIVHQPFSYEQPMLTQRERQVAELVLKGLSNRAIAETLSIKERTVETHMTSIMSRLGVRSRHQLGGAFSEPQL